MGPTFSSNVPQAPTLWGVGTDVPHNWEKMSDSAKQIYKNHFVTAAMVGCTNKECHSHAMKAVKTSHKMSKGQWIPK